MSYITIKFKKLYKSASIPRYMRDNDAGMDIFAGESAAIEPGGFALVGSGVAIAVPHGYEGQVRPRSGLALRNGVSVLNTPGTIDENYRGELKVLLVNFGNEPFLVEPGMRIAQLVIAPVVKVRSEVCDVLDDTDRGAAGFGSTGI